MEVLQTCGQMELLRDLI